MASVISKSTRPSATASRAGTRSVPTFRTLASITTSSEAAPRTSCNGRARLVACTRRPIARAAIRLCRAGAAQSRHAPLFQQDHLALVAGPTRLEDVEVQTGGNSRALVVPSIPYCRRGTGSALLVDQLPHQPSVNIVNRELHSHWGGQLEANRCLGIERIGRVLVQHHQVRHRGADRVLQRRGNRGSPRQVIYELKRRHGSAQFTGSCVEAESDQVALARKRRATVGIASDTNPAGLHNARLKRGKLVVARCFHTHKLQFVRVSELEPQ